MQMTVIAATTAAVATQRVAQSDKAPWIFLAASNLAGAEECDIYVNCEGTWIVVADPATGNAVKLTATIPVQVLRGGPLYGIAKDATAGNCAVTVDYGTAQN